MFHHTWDITLKHIFVTVAYMWISIFFRFLMQKYKIPFSCCAFTLTFTTVCSIILKEVGMSDFKPLEVERQEFFNIYLPLIIFKTSFGIDFHAFYKCLPQILIMCFPAAVFSVAFCTYILTKMVGYFWNFNWCVSFGVLFTASYPIEVVDQLRNLGDNTRHKRVLLEGDFLIATIVCMFVIKLAKITQDDAGEYTWQTAAFLIFKFVVPSVLTGAVLGFVGYLLLRYVDNKVSISLATLSLPYIGTFIVSSCGSSVFTAVLIIGLIMSKARISLLKDIDHCLDNFWALIGHLVNSFGYVIIAHQTLYELVFKMNSVDFVLIFVSYFVVTVARFLSYLLFFPLLSRTGYGFNFYKMIICVWGGLGSPIMYGIRNTDIFLIHLIAFFYITHLINSSLSYYIFKFMGLANISLARQVNMNACLRYVEERRDDTIAVLKKDRFLADSNWLVVNKATDLKHPYQLQGDYVIEKEHFFVKGYRAAFCPDCKKNVYGDPTPREFKEMTREAKTRILKAKKISYSKQYENGMISATAIRSLLEIVERAMDTEEAVIELDDLFKDSHKKGFFIRSAIRQRLDKLFRVKAEEIKPPRRPGRRLLYRIVQSKFFDLFIYLILIGDIANNSVRLARERDFNVTSLAILHAFLDGFFIAIYGCEFVMKIYAYSWIYIWKDGFKTYFSSKWNIQEFILLIMAIPGIIVCFVYGFSKEMTLTLKIFLYMTFLRALRFFKLIILCQNCYAKLMEHYDTKLNNQVAFYYELGKTYVTAIDEVLEKLPYMVDHLEIRNDIKNKLLEQRLYVLRHLGTVEYEKPTIAITVKTIQAIRTILNGMKDTLEELKVSGWVESHEFKKLKDILQDRYKYVTFNVKIVHPNSPDTIFKETSWLVGEEPLVLKYIYSHIVKKKYKAGDTVLNVGKFVDGIFVMVKGLFAITYTPTDEVIEKFQDFGFLPTIDNLPVGKYREPYVDFMVPGNCCGRIASLTQRAYSGVLKAETDGELYLLKKQILQNAIEMSTDPVRGLECRLWYSLAIHIAIPILTNIPHYQTDTQEKIKYVLERAFVPKLNDYKYFSLNEYVEDVVLIEGLAIDHSTKNIYTAPRYIPRNVRKLVLPKSSYLRLPVEVQTKILIIPTREANEYDIMYQDYQTQTIFSPSSFGISTYDDFRNRSSSLNIFKRLSQLTNRVYPTREERASLASDTASAVTIKMFDNASTTSFLINVQNPIIEKDSEDTFGSAR